MKLNKKTILKWLGESVLIVISVLLAFFIDEKREQNNQKQDLITQLTDLESSFRKDSLIYRVRIFYLKRVDSLNEAVLKTIEDKKVPGGLNSLDVYNPLNNYSLKRILGSDNIGLLTRTYRDELYAYSSWVDFVTSEFDNRYSENCNRLSDMIYEEGDLASLSPKFKGLVRKNRDILSELIVNDSTSIENAHELVLLTKKEILILKGN